MLEHASVTDAVREKRIGLVEDVFLNVDPCAVDIDFFAMAADVKHPFKATNVSQGTASPKDNGSGNDEDDDRLQNRFGPIDRGWSLVSNERQQIEQLQPPLEYEDDGEPNHFHRDNRVSCAPINHFRLPVAASPLVLSSLYRIIDLDQVDENDNGAYSAYRVNGQHEPSREGRCRLEKKRDPDVLFNTGTSTD